MADDKRVAARQILAQIDMPPGQLNDRSAWTLLALGDLTPDRQWADAEAPIVGITPVIEWIANNYGRRYAPNTRETVRKQTMHQFVEAGLAVYNGDVPSRAVNSPRTGYQLTPEALALLRSYGSSGWEQAVSTFMALQPGLASRYAAERKHNRVPVHVGGGQTIALSPGTHSELIRDIIESFAEMHLPGAKLIYVGDTGDKTGFFDENALGALGITIDRHGKMPDVVFYDIKRKWLVLVESVTSHGPVNGKRHSELARLFGGSHAGLVYVTAFPSRGTMSRYLSDLAWETEVWVASDPTHLIHFNGDRFLGPH